MTTTARYASGHGFDGAFGLDLQNDNGIDNGALDFDGIVLPTRYALERQTWAGFGQLSYAATSALQLSTGARFDKTGGDGGHISPQAGATYDLAISRTRLTMAWGRAFKLPSFYALGNPIVGDPTLSPERATNLSTGVSQAFGASPDRLKLDWYDTHDSDLIDFIPGPVPKLVNLSKARVRGAEVSYEIHSGSDLSVTPSFSYTHA